MEENLEVSKHTFFCNLSFGLRLIILYLFEDVSPRFWSCCLLFSEYNHLNRVISIYQKVII